MTTHDVLRAARAYLLEHGWTRRYGQHGEPRCVLGALSSAWGSNDWNVGSAPSLAGVELMDATGRSSLPKWNDDPGRTFDEVIAAFDVAIEATAPPRPDESPFTALEDLPAEQYLDCLSTLALIPAEAIGA